MANSLTALNPEFWSRRMQIVRIDETVHEALANMELREVLSKGDTVHKPYRSRMRVQAYTKGSDITPTDVSATDESLSVDQSKVVSFYFDDIDDIQNGYQTESDFAEDAGRELYSFVDGEFLAEILNASDTIDDGDIGGTAGTAVTLTPSNVVKVLAAAKRKLTRANADLSDIAFVASPLFMQALLERVEGKDSAFGDSTGKNGNIGRYMGFDLYESNNLTYTARLTPADNPSNGETITIDGLVFTFVSSIGTTVGNVLIEGTTAGTLDNLVLALNQGASAGTKYVAFTAVDSLRKLDRMSAVDGTTYVDLTYKGGSEVTVAASVADNAWSKQIVHCSAMQKGAIDMAMQKAPNVHFKDDPDRLGKNVHTHALYGLKTFTDGAAVMLDVQVSASSV